jgi:hypothetical protein
MSVLLSLKMNFYYQILQQFSLLNFFTRFARKKGGNVV